MVLERVKTAFQRLACDAQSGQTLVEYGLIIGLVAIAAIFGISLVANEVNSLWGGIVTDVSTAIAEVLGL